MASSIRPVLSDTEIKAFLVAPADMQNPAIQKEKMPKKVYILNRTSMDPYIRINQTSFHLRSTPVLKSSALLPYSIMKKQIAVSKMSEGSYVRLRLLID